MRYRLKHLATVPEWKPVSLSTGRGAYQTPFKKELPTALGSTHLRSITLLAEPFSTSVILIRTRLFATTTKIGTRGCSIQAHAQDFVA